MLLVGLPLVRCSASGTKVCEGGQLKIKPRYWKKLASRGMSLECARLARRRPLAGRIDVKAILTLEKQDVLAKLACSIAGVAMADAVVPAKRACSTSAMPINEEDCTMGELAEVEEVLRVGARRRFRDLQESCHAKKGKVPESVSKALGPAVELVDDAVGTLSPGAGLIVHSRIDDFTGQPLNTVVKVVSLTTKLSDQEDAPNKVEPKHENLVRMIGTETNKLEDLIIAEQDDALSCYHGVLRSVRGTAKAVDKCNVGPIDS